MRGPAAALREVLRDFLSFHRANWAEGKLSVCNEAAVTSPARRLLASGAGLPDGWGRWDVYGIAESCLAMKGERGAVVFRKLARAFEFLELVCANLFLSPWRREIKSLKTFTGNYVYYVQSVLPEGVVQRLLKEIGYVPTTATEFSLVRKPDEGEAEQAAFEIFLARLECEDLLDMAEDVRDSDLGDILQKRAQRRWHPAGNLAGKAPPFLGKENVVVGGRNERQGGFSPPQTDVAPSKLTFEEAKNTELRSELGLQCTTAEPRAAPSKCVCKQNANQWIQAGASTGCPVKGSDSEDFLIKYSDLVIGQKPLHFADVPPKASDDATPNTGVMGTKLGLPTNGAPSLTLLSPSASGPQALAILNDVTLESKVPYDYGSPESSTETIESKICGAMRCLNLHRANLMDHPQELKGDNMQHDNHHAGHSCLREERPTDLSSSEKTQSKKDCVERLVHPVEETAQTESRGSKGRAKDFSHSQMKLADLPGGTREGFHVDLYSSDLFCSIAGCGCTMAGSNYSRPLAGLPGACDAGQYCRHCQELLRSSHPLAQYHSSIPARVPYREGSPFQFSFSDFQSCVAPVTETNPEGYVIINKEH
ncbi:spermatogenesis-associated protein 2-like [Varanus komodoensis]|uniref:Spermatogenesis-associated protein 2 PUB-like domain-containing protein n=1 Tax=Varanus komodoensis TaxID=61221 RepID=A0A8D2LEG1_VARKO|nr:spermatogenesis-associated protein 2-like [Varanus komodoensis]